MSTPVVWDSVELSDLRSGEYRTIRLVTDPDGKDYIEIATTSGALPVRWVKRT